MELNGEVRNIEQIFSYTYGRMALSHCECESRRKETFLGKKSSISLEISSQFDLFKKIKVTRDSIQYLLPIFFFKQDNFFVFSFSGFTKISNINTYEWFRISCYFGATFQTKFLAHFNFFSQFEVQMFFNIEKLTLLQKAM